MSTLTEKQEDQQQPEQSWVVLEERSQGSIGQPLFVSIIVVIKIDYIYHHYQIQLSNSSSFMYRSAPPLDLWRSRRHRLCRVLPLQVVWHGT